METESRVALVSLITVLATACVDAEHPAPSSEAGRFSLGPALVRIGSESEYPLHNVIKTYEDFAGRLFVIQFGTPTVAVFDSGGKLIAELGGAGGGPGRFSQPAEVGSLDGSTWISDVGLRKIVLYDPDLTYVRDVVLPGVLMSPSALGSGGRMIATSTAGSQVDWHAVDASGHRNLYSQGIGTAGIRVGFNRGRMMVLNPFRDGDLALPDPRNLSLVVVEAARAEISLLHLAWNGDTLLRRGLPVSAQPLSDEWVEDAVDRLLDGVPPSIMAAGLRDSVIHALPRPAQTHALTRGTVGFDGTLWFGQNRLGGSRWHAVNLPTGEYKGFVDLPPEQELRGGTREHVWVLEPDASDVQHLVKRSILAPS